MHEFDQFPPVTRRTTLVTLVTAGVTGVTRPADANPVLRLALWLLGTVAAWAVGRELDRLVDGRRGLVDPEREAWKRTSERAYATPETKCGCLLIPEGFVVAMKQHEVEPGDCFHEWGPPTSQPMWRPAPGGLVGGQFYSRHRRRFVAMRTYGDHAVFLPLVNAHASYGHRLAVLGEETRGQTMPRLHHMIADPWSYEFREEDRPDNPHT